MQLITWYSSGPSRCVHKHNLYSYGNKQNSTSSTTTQRAPLVLTAGLKNDKCVFLLCKMKTTCLPNLYYNISTGLQLCTVYVT
ncbi:hypothetical protein FKM82_014965 [Ascaphus truei]